MVKVIQTRKKGGRSLFSPLFLLKAQLFVYIYDIWYRLTAC